MALPISILLIDANKSYREITRKMLKFYDAGFAIDDCASVKECLEKIRLKQYDLILTNETLEDGDCFALISALRHHMIDIPILIMFEEGHEESAMKAFEMGAVDYIIKARGYLTALPFTVKKVLERKKYSSEQKKSEHVEPRQNLFIQRGYFILDRHGRFQSANPGMESLSGYSEDELLELTILDLLPKGTEWELFEWLQQIEKGLIHEPFQTQLIGKFGGQIPVQLKLTPVRDTIGQLKSFRGEIEEKELAPEEPGKDDLDQFSSQQLNLIEGIWDILAEANSDPMPRVLGRIAHFTSQYFKFQRATIALLDQGIDSYVKVAMVGYAQPAEQDKKRIEVPAEVLERIFGKQHRIKVLYYQQQERDQTNFFEELLPERRSQARREPDKWHPRDVVMINLADTQMRSFGYISLDHPLEEFRADRTFFTKLELFSRIVSMAIQSHAQILEREQKNRRLTQVLVTSNIFKLYLNMQDLLKEIVWSIKFSLDYKLVALMLVSRKSGAVEVRSVACDGKIKAQQMLSISFSISEFMKLLESNNRLGKCYFIDDPNTPLQAIKEIYYSGLRPPHDDAEWPRDGILIVPLKSRHGRIMGAIVVDDPVDQSLPDAETLRTLEILANQVSVAIDNRLLYVDAKRKAEKQLKAGNGVRHEHSERKSQGPTYSEERRSIWQKLFRDVD